MKYLITILLLVGCAKPPSDSQTHTYIYSYGDSTSYGLVHPSYVETATQTHSAVLIQKAVGGTEMIDKNQHDTVMSDNYYFWSNQTTVVLFSPGLNDAILNGTNAAYMTTYEADLTDIITWMHWNKRTAFIGTPIHVCDETRFVANSIIDQYAAINRKVVAAVGDPKIVLVDYNANFTPTTSNTVDCAHPNALGNTQMTAVLMTLWR